MLIEKLDTSLTNPYAIRDLKDRLTLEWLHAFQFSTLDILAERLGSTPRKIRHRFRSLLQAGFIQNFLNNYTYLKRFLMLTPKGANYLEQTVGLDSSEAVTHVYRLNTYPNILHDLAVQRAALRRLDSYTELIPERQIQIPETFHRPDLLMRNIKNYWIAFEYERSRKQPKRIFLSFINHAQAIIKQHYDATYYLFDREQDLAYYQGLFNAKEWPQYDYNRSTGKMTPKQTPFLPDTITNLRKCFRFTHEPQRH